MTMEAILRRAPVIPVLTIEDAAAAVPLARALVAGGLPVLEITLRTPAGLPAIERIARAAPEAVAGAGTVLSAGDLGRARDAGARFAVSPGTTAALLDAASGFPYLPGVATPSDIMAARAAGLRFLKFFPAETCGGTATLAAFAGPFGDIGFCPTGGIREATLRAYLDLPNVVAVGGTWLATRADMAAGSWGAVTARAARAVAIAGGTVAA
jgi:2-dehydro-3-deoxyphosphogluconate aldolase/(4S)-4-hydroxy-2-oxoglutarate aldolase